MNPMTNGHGHCPKESESMKKLIQLAKSKSGMTMVSVIVAFVLLLMCFGMLSMSINTASNMLKKATDNRRESEAFLNDYYSGTLDSQKAVDTGTLVLKNASKSSDRITCDADISSIHSEKYGKTLYRIDN